MSKSKLLKLFATTLLFASYVGCAEFHSKEPFCSDSESIRDDDFWTRSWSATGRLATKERTEEDAVDATLVWNDESQAYRVDVPNINGGKPGVEIRFFQLEDVYFANVALIDDNGAKNFPALVGALDDATIEILLVSPWATHYMATAAAEFDEKTIETALKLADNEFTFEKLDGGDLFDSCSGEIDVSTERLQQSLLEADVYEYAPLFSFQLKSAEPFGKNDGPASPDARRRFQETKADWYAGYLYNIAKKWTSTPTSVGTDDELRFFKTIVDQCAKETTNPKSVEKLEFVRKTLDSVGATLNEPRLKNQE